MLTRIEQLDQRFPGLADQVTDWFIQGASVREVSELLFLQYNVFVPRTTVSSYRARRCARMLEFFRQERMTAAATEALMREAEKAEPPRASSELFTVKLTSFFLPEDKSCRLQPLKHRLVEMGGRSLKM
jgi:hypothetical protein